MAVLDNLKTGVIFYVSTPNSLLGLTIILVSLAGERVYTTTTDRSCWEGFAITVNSLVSGNPRELKRVSVSGAVRLRELRELRES